MKWFINVFKKSFVFSGRSQRKEFWMFILCLYIISMIISILYKISGNKVLYSIILAVYCLVTIIPCISLGVRRLHDTGRSGYALLLGLIPFGIIILIIYFVQKGTSGDNIYGNNSEEIQNKEQTITNYNGEIRLEPNHVESNNDCVKIIKDSGMEYKFGGKITFDDYVQMNRYHIKNKLFLKNKSFPFLLGILILGTLYVIVGQNSYIWGTIVD